MIQILIACIALVATGCGTVAESLKQGTYYRRDIAFKVNGQSARGALVVPKAPSYTITGSYAPGFDYLFIRSCHREETAQNVGGVFAYTYQPIAGIEDDRACPIEIRGLEQSKGRNSWGFVDFQDARNTLLAAMECNGGIEHYPGVSVCQAPVGLIERIDFQVPVLVDAGTAECAIPEPIDGLHYEFRMPRGRCTIKFMEKAGAHRMHRLSTLGYEDVVAGDF